jgi:cell division FtsZ-interacting protein ZapD
MDLWPKSLVAAAGLRLRESRWTPAIRSRLGVAAMDLCPKSLVAAAGLGVRLRESRWTPAIRSRLGVAAMDTCTVYVALLKANTAQCNLKPYLSGLKMCSL